MNQEMTIRIALADDHKIFRDGIRMALSGKEYLRILWEADDGKDLMHKIMLKKPDVLLMDIRMPNLDGHEAARLIREAERETGKGRVRIVALTANAFHEDRAAAAAAGIDGFVTECGHALVLRHAHQFGLRGDAAGQPAFAVFTRSHPRTSETREGPRPRRGPSQSVERTAD